MSRRVVVRRGMGLLGVAAVGGTAYMAGSTMGKKHAAEQMAQPPQPVAAPAPMQGAPSSTPVTPISQEQKISQLKELAKLQKSGILTPEEFEKEKSKILGQ